ncbi:hypothetical protein [Sphingomonas sp. IW22]|jgi:hypothetical protein|uniref:hypothetical protein n=1 Tax=Sphingomonas sp. IW22 TaxID=3242489 RepID=UPI0035215010
MVVFPAKPGRSESPKKEPHFVAAAGALSRMSPDGVWRFSVEKCCETSRSLDAAGRIQSQYWCQKNTLIGQPSGSSLPPVNQEWKFTKTNNSTNTSLGKGRAILETVRPQQSIAAFVFATT